jgi:hypothetical protein
MMRTHAILLAAGLLLALQLVSAAAVSDLSKDCPGNLLKNAGFEEPNTETTKTQIVEPTSNSKWGWYEKIPGVLLLAFSSAGWLDCSPVHLAATAHTHTLSCLQT